MKVKARAPQKFEEEETPQLSTMYCTQEIGKILQSHTLEELSKLGLREDVGVSYTKIFFSLLLCGIGTYSALFTSLEKSKDKLRLTVIAFFIVLVIMMAYDRLVLKGTSFRVYIDDHAKVYLWCNVNWRNATYDIAYASSNNLSEVTTYEVPLGEAFFEDGKFDKEWYSDSMAKLCKEIKATHMKKTI
ncbi:hypothetical protein X943_001492 [Babesia divergens]|uniref:Signal peptidase complex subunit 2 n=1 Tax=Babesia divergens TaxID=32595 RepID=A0AAD9GEC0_BABDI|nr:hypothetical protein X943_001492 [Babesia divergens]